MQEVYKKKGDPRDCDSSRGILLADHSGKALAGIVKQAIDPIYESKMPATQFGAVPRRGTDQASLMIRAAIEVSILKGCSIAVLFVDLVKAFDKVIREIVFGWGPSPPADKKTALRALGVSEAAANWILQYLDEKGHLFHQWQVDPEAAALCQAMRASAWRGVEGVGER